MNRKSKKVTDSLLKRQDFKDEMVYDGRIKARIMQYNQNNKLRKLMKSVIYSYGINLGHCNQNYEKNWNKINFDNFTQKDTSDHILGLLLIILKNINLKDTGCQNLSQNKRERILEIFESSIHNLNLSTGEIQESDYSSAERLFFICEILTFTIELLQNNTTQEDAISQLKSDSNLEYLINLLEKLSEMLILAKPHAFDPIEFTPIFDENLIQANQAAVDDRLHRADVIMESYKREAITKILKIFEEIWKFNQRNKENKSSSNELCNLNKILSNPCSKECKKILQVLQNVIIKWTNFADEYETSSQIFNIILLIDNKDLELSKETLKEDISELCLKALPYFIHLEDQERCDEIIEKMNQIRDNLIEAITHQEKESFYNNHIGNIYCLVSLLSKIYWLLNEREDLKKYSPEEDRDFIRKSYTILSKVVEIPSIADSVWKFDGEFLKIQWKQNRGWAKLHTDLIKKILDKSKVSKLNLDSCKLQKKIPQEEETVFQDEDFFEDFIQKLVDSEYQINDEEDLNNSGEEVGTSCIVPNLIQYLSGKFTGINDEEMREQTRKLQLLLHRLFQTINDIDPTPETQIYVFKCLEMLNQILKNDEIMELSEIKEMFYTKHATNVMFSLILKEYNFFGCAKKIRKSAYDILIKMMENDMQASRKSFRIWTHCNNNKNRFFGRIESLINQFKRCFIDKKLSKILNKHLKKTDYEELLLSIEWLTILCTNDKNWQNYLRIQDNCVKNHNILDSIVDLMRTSILRLKHEYVTKLLLKIVRLITETINGGNKYLAIRYARIGVVDYSMEILKYGLSDEEVKSLDKFNSKIVLKQGTSLFIRNLLG